MTEWWSIISLVLSNPAHTDVVIQKWMVPDPQSAGFKPHLGEPRGQSADYRMPAPDGRSVHVREYQTNYSIHWDNVDPDVDPIGHLRQDAPHWLVALGAGVGGTIGAVCGYAIGKQKGAASLGALGALLGAAIGTAWASEE